MISTKELHKKGLRKWPILLRATIDGQDIFPFEIPLGSLSGSELLAEFETVGKWIRETREYAAASHLELRTKTIQHRQLGTQVLPTHLIVADQNQYLKWMAREDLFKAIASEAEITLRDFPVLRDWLRKNVETLESNLYVWPSLRAVLHRFQEGNFSGLFLRELDIPWIDTKFVENNRLVLAQLLSLILPEAWLRPEVLPSSSARFCQKFGLRYDQILIRFRWLDEKLAPGGHTDMSLPLSDFIRLNPPVENVFITENKVNGLAFPKLERSLVVFGLGGGLDVLQEVEWLQSKRVFYWGDIDTHGFALLARFRRFLPKAESFLMDAHTFESFKVFWVQEAVSYKASYESDLLQPFEAALLKELEGDGDNGSRRLEQERIPIVYVKARLKDCLGAL